MMGQTGFLSNIAEKYFDEHKENIRNIAFVFPNKRSAVYFRNILATISPVPLWSPPIFSINDLMVSCSELEIPETYELVFELYETFKKTFPNKQFSIEFFFQTGKTIISDFNEIDKNLVAEKTLFKALKDLQGLEKSNSSEDPKFKKDYLEFWDELEKIYHPFRKSLEFNQFGYEGMIFRKVSENISLVLKKKWTKLVFAGFNALSRAELSIMSQLEKMGMADIFSESDTYFLNDKDQEAGHFLRKNNKYFNSNKMLPIINDGLMGVKNISIVETTSDAGQAKITGIKLKELIAQGENLADTAVILPNENLLFPILNSLPKNIGKGNISIGYPLRQTSAYSLYYLLMELHNKKGKHFHRKDLIKVLNHPYIKMIDDPEIIQLSKNLKKGTGTFIETLSPIGTLLRHILSEIKSSVEFLMIFINILEIFRKKIIDEEITLSGIEKEFVFHFHSLIVKLNGIIERTGEPVSLKGFQRMFNDLIASVHIPFTGEPLEGLQILGVLEMQNLRFKNLFILSMNEDKFPSGKYSQTFIPQDIRKMSGLPLFGDRESIFAYHFYRMLGNSTKITLLYSGVSPGSSRIEKSRFIDQILLEYKENNKNAVINHLTAEFKIDTRRSGSIRIAKTETTLALLRKRDYSATSFRTWMECSLKFWFRYILGLKDNKNVDDAHNFAKFGSIFHKVLELVYSKQEGKTINSIFFEKLSDETLESIIKQSFSINKLSETEIGMNKITFEIIRKFTKNFFNNEKSQTPFKIHSLEKEIRKKIIFNTRDKTESVEFTGKIDRIDYHKNILRIIDYKTGITNLSEIKDNMIEVDWTKHKEAFQLLFYAYLLEENALLQKKFKLGIYPFKKLSDKLKFVKINGDETIDRDILTDFQIVLEHILEEIFDPELDFKQTEDKAACKYCLHKDICER